MRRACLLFALVTAPLIVRPSLRADQGFGIASLKFSERAQQPYVPGEVIVEFRGPDPRDVERAIRAVGGVRARRSAFGPRYLVDLDPGVSVPDAIGRFATMPDVDYAEPNGTMRAFFTPNDPAFRAQWNFRMLNVERTWDIQKGDPSVVVAVIDTGIAYEDFGPFRKAPDWGDTPFVRGFNVYTRDDHANDDNFHGTHVASTIAEATNNARGASGLAFNCALMPVKVLDAEGLGSFFSVAEGIDYARTFNEGGRRVRVINLSLGGNGNSQSVSRAVDSAVEAGIT